MERICHCELVLIREKLHVLSANFKILTAAIMMMMIIIIIKIINYSVM
jgi:hypothetical protein